MIYPSKSVFKTLSKVLKTLLIELEGPLIQHLSRAVLGSSDRFNVIDTFQVDWIDTGCWMHDCCDRGIAGNTATKIKTHQCLKG